MCQNGGDVFWVWRWLSVTTNGRIALAETEEISKKKKIERVTMNEESRLESEKKQR